MGGELIFYILFVALGLGVVSWFATPKGDNRTSVPPPYLLSHPQLTRIHSVIRTSVLLAITCCYLM